MPLLVYSVADFVPFTIIRSADVNSKFSDIATLLNTTGLDDTNIQDDGITRASKLKDGTADTIVINAPTTGEMSEINIAAGGLLSKNSSGNLAAVAAGTSDQILRSNGGDVPSWIDNPSPTPSHYVKSGAINSDGQPDYIRPDGGGADDFTIRATTTNLVVVIENVEYTLTSDISVTGLDAPATTNNTASLNDPNANDEDFTKQLGEGSLINYDGGGTNFLPTSGAGVLHGLKINDGSTDEYFIGRFSLDATSTSGSIRDLRRGYFVNSSGTAISRVAVADNDTLTIQKLFWVFVSSTGTGTATDLEPIYAFAEPTNVNGQMWFDLSTNQWKRSNGTSFSVVTELLIGQVIVDENDEVTGARSCDFFIQTADTNTLEVVDADATTVICNVGAKVSVLGSLIEFSKGQPIFDITDTDQRVGTEDASTQYFYYISNTGQLKIEATAPYHRDDLRGDYHPHKPWRAVASAFNNSSSDLEAAGGLRHQSRWSIATTTDITSTDVTDPTKGTIVRDSIRWRREGPDMIIQCTFEQSTSGTAGSVQDYRIALPGGFAIDQRVAEFEDQNRTHVGNGTISANANGFDSASRLTNVNTVDPQGFVIYTYVGTSDNFVGFGVAFQLSGATVQFHFDARVPILGWS